MSQRRKRQLSLIRLFERAAEPGLVINRDRTIVAANQALGERLGVPVDELIGQRLQYAAPDSQAAATEPNRTVLNGLCPPPSLLDDSPHLFLAYLASASEHSHASEQAETGWQAYPASLTPFTDEKPHTHWLISLQAEPAEGPPGEEEANEQQRLHAALLAWRQHSPTAGFVDPLIGNSSWMERARQQFQLIVQTRPRVLIVGPPGSGHEHLAKALHAAEPTETAGPLIPLDCELLTAELLQSTIVQVKKWLQRQASTTGGWFLLLNLHQLNEESQLELSGLLDLPGLELPTLATSEQSLDELTHRADFRGDLARRLATVTLELPPLAERTADIPLLAQAYLETQNASREQQLEGLSTDAMDALLRYPWPRNLTELHEFLEEASERARGPVVQLHDLPPRIRYAEAADRFAPVAAESIDLDRYLGEIEEELIRRAVQVAAGNKTRAAELLGISRARLHRKLDELEQGQ